MTLGRMAGTGWFSPTSPANHSIAAIPTPGPAAAMFASPLTNTDPAQAGTTLVDDQARGGGPHTAPSDRPDRVTAVNFLQNANDPWLHTGRSGDRPVVPGRAYAAG